MNGVLLSQTSTYCKNLPRHSYLAVNPLDGYNIRNFSRLMIASCLNDSRAHERLMMGYPVTTVAPSGGNLAI